MNRKILAGLILVILVATSIIVWTYWSEPEPEKIIIENPNGDVIVVEIKPSCFDSSQDPIPVCSCDDLQRMEENLSANYELKNDVNCSDTKDWNDKKGFNPIATDCDSPFLGVFDGRDRIIANLFINRPDEDFTGLFGCFAGKIMNVGLENVDVRGYNETGALVGGNYSGVITNSYATGKVSGDNDTGGLVGENAGTGIVANSYAEVIVFDGGKDVGGLVGENEGSEGIITNCYATGSVSSKKGTGGLVGENEGTVTNCYATGNVTGDENVGGFVGDNEGTILDSYATGIVFGNKDVGGFMGDSHGGITRNSFSTGEVTGFDRIGGFNGVNHGGTITNCYWNKPAGSSLSIVGSNKEGGVVECFSIDNNKRYFYNIDNKPMNAWKLSSWSRENNNKDYPVLIEKVTTNFDPDPPDPPDLPDPPDPPDLPDPPDPPDLPDPPDPPDPPESSCFDSAQNIIPICNCDDLQKMEENLSANYELKNNIDCSDTKNWNNGKGFSPIAPDTNSRISGFQGARFSGTFNGQNYIITGLFIKRPNEDFIGLFAFSLGEITNIGLKDVNISGREEVGGLVGDNQGIITSSYTTGTVSSNKHVGGLVGINEKPGSITNSYSSVTLSNSIEDVGGLVGENEAIITNCYATGKVTGAENVGGLVGDNEGTITNCYATGIVSGVKDVGGLVGDNEKAVINSYWNKPAGSSLDCVGKIKSGTVDCSVIQGNKGYFYNIDNEPMNIWKFPPWSKENDGQDYPILD